MGEVIPVTVDDGGELYRAIPHPRKTPPDSDTRPQSIGQDLCGARQRSGKMLMDVWRDLKISPHHLTAIEQGRFNALPGRVYAIGYVRSYAAYLGLDAEEFVGRLKAEMARADTWQPVIDPLPLSERKDRLETEFAASVDAEEPVIGLSFPSERGLPQSVIAALLIAVLISSGYYVIASAQRTAVPPVTPVPARLAAEAGLTKGPAAMARLAAIEQPAPKPREPAPLAITDAAPTQLAPVAPLATVEPVPKFQPKPAVLPRTEETPQQTVSASAEPAPHLHPALPLGQRYGMRNKNSRIILRLHRSTHVTVQGARNNFFIDRVLDAGDTYRVPNMAGLRLSAPDAGAVELILDDTTIGFAGKDGAAAKRLSLDPKSVVHLQRGG